MASIHDLQEQIEQIDRQVLKLLQERNTLYNSLEGMDGINDAEVLGFWMEEAAERGLNDEVVEKLCKLVLTLGKKHEEE